MTPLLILGCQRSGTTLLASMLGRHSEVNMLFESTSGDVFKLVGKKYQGNKICAWRQIRLKKRASKWGHLVNRIVNLNGVITNYQIRRIYPTSKLSIEDYNNLDSIIITIRRDKESIVRSLVNRTPLNKKQALNEYINASKILDALKHKAIEVSFDDLVNNPRSVMNHLCKKLELSFEKRMMEGPKFNIIYPNDGFIKEKAKDPG